MYCIFPRHGNMMGLQQAKQLAENLIQTVSIKNYFNFINF